MGLKDGGGVSSWWESKSASYGISRPSSNDDQSMEGKGFFVAVTAVAVTACPLCLHPHLGLSAYTWVCSCCDVICLGPCE